jgi:hypothetical protein
MVKVARSETFEMSIDWPPAIRMGRSVTVPNEPPPPRTRIMAPHPAGYRITAAVLSYSRFTRLLLVQLILIVTDRSRSHGHTP